MRNLFIILLLLLLNPATNAQIDPKKTNYYYDTELSKSGNISLKALNPVSRYNFAKFELIIDNKSDNFLYFVSKESKLSINDKEYPAIGRKKTQICLPGKKISPTLKFEGSKEFLSEKMTFIPDGFYTFASKGESVNAPDFKLPPSQNFIDAAPFKIQMLKLSKETKVTAVKFSIRYTGDKMGIVSMSKAAVRTPDGTLWANARTGDMNKVMQKGETKKFTLYFEVPAKEFDMQFTDLFIVWGDALSESELKPMDLTKGEIIIDELTTKKKNK